MRRYLSVGAVLLAWLMGVGVAAWGQSVDTAVGSPWLLAPTDLEDARTLAIRIREAKDPVSRFLRGYCSLQTRQLIAQVRFDAPISPKTVETLVEDLNRMMVGTSLYEKDRFAAVALSPETEAVGKRNPHGDELVHLNRLLLEDAYPNEFRPRPELAWLLKSDDVADIRSFAFKIRDARDPVSQHLRAGCSPGTRQWLADLKSEAPLPAPGPAVLIGDLNALMQSQNLYEKYRWQEIKLSDKTKELLATDPPQGAARVQLNRMLLEDAYPGELARLVPLPIEVRADSLEFDNERNLMIGNGHVFVRKDNETIKSDHAVVNKATLDVYAEGNVTFERNSDIWIGKKLRYNFKTHRGDFGGFVSFMDPFYVRAKSSQKVTSEEYEMKDAILTTCEGENPTAYFKAKTVWIVPGKHVRAEHVVLFIRGVPVMYVPFWNQNIGSRNFISLVPGYNSRMYAFLLTAFNYRISRHVEAASHVDFRMRRGLAVGQDVLWSSSGNAKGLSTEQYMADDYDAQWAFGNTARSASELLEEQDKWHGDFISYYARDSWPDEGAVQNYKVDNDRYRLRLFHNQSFDDANYFMAQLNYLSDHEFMEQFFRKEFKVEPEPQNYLVLGHRADGYSADVTVEKRLNNFYTTVERLPEGRFIVRPQEIGDTRVYYKSKSTAGYYSKVWDEANTNSLGVMTNQEYSSGRFDTDHQVYYPTKHFDFLNITPRAGYRGTYYSKTKEDYTNIVTTTSRTPTVSPTGTNTSGGSTTTVTSVTNTLMRELGAQYRNVYELGVETSFKAYRVWETHPGDIINNVRHIVEPYANYTYVPDPNVHSNQLYQFDATDGILKENDIRIGTRQKIQTKRQKVYDLINADIYTTYRLEKQTDDQNDWGDIMFDVLSTPFDWMEARITGDFNQYDSRFEEFNTRLQVQEKQYWKFGIEHRYSYEDSNLLSGDVLFSPFISWAFGGYGRYEFDDSTLEAYGISIQKAFDCLATKIGYEWEDSQEYTVWLQFWFTQFPKVRMDVGL